MAKKKQLDNLSLDMIQCEKDGYGVHYGRWKATQPIVKPVPVEVPEDWKVCPHCGKAFKLKQKNQKYCEANCCVLAQRERDKYKTREYRKQWEAKRKEKLRNESYA